jgi:hypothetical protein
VTDAKQVAKWIRELNESDFAVRKKALRNLESIGRLSEPALKKALRATPTLESRRRIESLLYRLEIETASPEIMRWLRAVQVIEHIGGRNARQLLQQLADGQLLPVNIRVSK